MQRFVKPQFKFPLAPLFLSKFAYKKLDKIAGDRCNAVVEFADSDTPFAAISAPHEGPGAIRILSVAHEITVFQPSPTVTVSDHDVAQRSLLLFALQQTVGRRHEATIEAQANVGSGTSDRNRLCAGI